MRKNMEAVLTAWDNRRSARFPSCWTDGDTIFSYDTAILVRDGDGRQILNATKYSATTSQQQAAIWYWVGNVVEVSGLPRGVKGEGVIAAWHIANPTGIPA